MRFNGRLSCPDCTKLTRITPASVSPLADPPTPPPPHDAESRPRPAAAAQVDLARALAIQRVGAGRSVREVVMTGGSPASLETGRRPRRGPLTWPDKASV